MTIKSKAAVAYKAAESLSIEIVNVGLPKDDEVLVEIKATGILSYRCFYFVRDGPRRAIPSDTWT